MFQRSPRLRILAAGLFLAAVAGCSQAAGTAGPGVTAGPGASVGAGAATAQPQGSTPAIGTTRSACDLLTDAEIEAVTGYTVASKRADHPDVAYEDHCVWLFSDNHWVLVLGIQAAGGGGEYDLQFEYESGTPVAGVGDRAFMGAVSDALYTLRGDTLIFIQLTAVGEANDVEQRLAQGVLAHLDTEEIR